MLVLRCQLLSSTLLLTRRTSKWHSLCLEIIVASNHYHQNLTKCNILNTSVIKNNVKFAYHNLEKLCPWFLNLTSDFFWVLGFGLNLDYSCIWPREGLSSKSRSLASDSFECLALVSNVGSSTPPLPINVHLIEQQRVCLWSRTSGVQISCRSNQTQSCQRIASRNRRLISSKWAALPWRNGVEMVPANSLHTSA